MGRESKIRNLIDVSLRDANTAYFERFVTRHHRSRRLVLFTRRCANGRIRHHVQVPAGMVDAFHRAFGARQRVAGLFSVRHREADHIYLRLGAWVYHLSFRTHRGREYWVLNDLGRRERFRESSSFRTERLVQLDPEEYRRLKAHAHALQAQSRRSGRLPGFTGNCVNVWMSAPVGRGGESLARVIGVREEDFGPRAMRQMLEGGNHKVLGAAVYPPRGKEFLRFERTRDPF